MKTLKTIKTLIAGFALVSMVACSPSENKDSGTVNKIDLMSLKSAEEKALAAEQLVTPYAFMYARDLFEMAIRQDPTNKRAQFYLYLLQPMMVWKGYLTRIRPLAIKENREAELNEYIQKLPNSALKTFLTEPVAQDIQKVEDNQKLVVSYAQSLNHFRKFLKSNPNLEISLNLNPSIFESHINQKMAESCTAEQKDSVITTNCDYQKVAQIDLNSADVAVLQQFTSGIVLSFSLHASYSLDGISELMKVQNATPAEFLQKVEQQKNLGKLYKNHLMGTIAEMGADYIDAVRWVQNNQQTLCPNGPETTVEARKHNLIKSPLCIEDASATEKSLALLTSALSGPIDYFDEELNYSTKVDYFAVSKRPVRDLKSLLPSEVDADGKVISLKDNTMGGILPNGDALKLIK